LTPKEKAKQLVDKFYQRFPLKMNVITTRGNLSWEYDSWNEAKECALIAAREIVDTLYEYHYDSASGAYEFWTEVKEELEAL
jgi:hypothetical protein